MEDHLDVYQLFEIQAGMYRKEQRTNKFNAAIQGINLDEEEESREDAFERIKMAADAENAGKTEDEFKFDMIGIEFESDDD